MTDNKSQLGQDKSGIKSFTDPSEIAKGGGSLLDDPKFGSREAINNRDASRIEINRQMHLNRKKERAVRVGYRAALKRGDEAGALRLLNDAESGGVNPFGIRQSGDRARQASTQISGKRSVEIAAGTRKYDPGSDYFQRSLSGFEPPKQEGEEEDPSAIQNFAPNEEPSKPQTGPTHQQFFNEITGQGDGRVGDFARPPSKLPPQIPTPPKNSSLSQPIKKANSALRGFTEQQQKNVASRLRGNLSITNSGSALSNFV